MAIDLPIIKQALKRGGDLYIEYLQDELEYQKHIASGNLKNGFYVRVHEVSNGLRMDVMVKVVITQKVEKKLHLEDTFLLKLLLKLPMLKEFKKI